MDNFFKQSFEQKQLIPLYFSRHLVLFRGRRKSSQKLAKRRTYVWGGGGLGRLRKASFKKKKKKLSSSQTTGAGGALRALMQIAWSSIERRPTLRYTITLPSKWLTHTVALTSCRCRVCRVPVPVQPMSPATVFFFFFASSEKSKSVLPFLSRTLKPGLRFLFVSGGREGGWEWNLRSSFRKLLRTFATAP